MSRPAWTGMAQAAWVRPRVGYRGSRLLFGRAAVLIRRGPALKVETRNGKSLSISVDEPEGAVAALGF